MSEYKKRKKKSSIKETFIPSLSSQGPPQNEGGPSLASHRENIFDLQAELMNSLELQRGIDKWFKKKLEENDIVVRDLTILKSIITEYLDAYILFGYNPEGERIIIQNFSNAKERDAIMEFLKTIFIKQQQENFLDIKDDQQDDF